jgi:hypothetical protein
MLLTTADQVRPPAEMWSQYARFIIYARLKPFAHPQSTPAITNFGIILTVLLGDSDRKR